MHADEFHRGEIWGAQAASLHISAASRNETGRVAGKLPAQAGWQPALPGVVDLTSRMTDSALPVADALFIARLQAQIL
jgi:hypothetical protein